MSNILDGLAVQAARIERDLAAAAARRKQYEADRAERVRSAFAEYEADLSSRSTEAKKTHCAGYVLSEEEACLLLRVDALAAYAAQFRLDDESYVATAARRIAEESDPGMDALCQLAQGRDILFPDGTVARYRDIPLGPAQALIVRRRMG